METEYHYWLTWVTIATTFIPYPFVHSNCCIILLKKRVCRTPVRVCCIFTEQVWNIWAQSNLIIYPQQARYLHISSWLHSKTRHMAFCVFTNFQRVNNLFTFCATIKQFFDKSDIYKSTKNGRRELKRIEFNSLEPIESMSISEINQLSLPEALEGLYFDKPYRREIV